MLLPSAMLPERATPEAPQGWWQAHLHLLDSCALFDSGRTQRPKQPTRSAQSWTGVKYSFLSLPPLSASLDIHYVAHPTATQTLELDTLTAKRRTHAACAGGRHTRLSLARGYPKGCGPRARNARQLELGSSVRRTSVVGGK